MMHSYMRLNKHAKSVKTRDIQAIFEFLGNHSEWYTIGDWGPLNKNDCCSSSTMIGIMKLYKSDNDFCHYTGL